MDVLVVTVVHTPLDARIHTRQIAALLEAGHRVRFAAPFHGYDIDPATVRADNLTTEDVPRAQGRRRIRAIIAARRLISAASEDVIIVHDPELLLAVNGARRPVIWDVHEDLAGSLADKSWLPTFLRRAVGLAVRWIERWAERRHTILLAEEGYAARFRRPHPVIGNRPWLPATPAMLGTDRVVYLGRVSELRGGRDILAIGRLLAPHGVQVHVMGPVDAELRDEFETAAAAGHVRMDGFVPNEAAMERLDGALAGLSLLHDHPNYRHSLPTKVLEYQAAGLPVITTPLPEAERIVRAAGSGVVVPFSDPDAVVTEVLRLRDDPEVATRFGQAGRRAAEEHWSWDAMAPRFVAEVVRVARGDGA